MNWPDDVDGDVLRRMEASGFDFLQPHVVQFEIEFESWPPPEDAIDALRNRFGEVVIFDEEAGGYLEFEVCARVSYDLVMTTQQVASDLMAPFGGTCESWGVLVKPRVA